MTIEAGRRALVTGGASGFGLGVARSLVECGAKVAIVDVNPSALNEAGRQLGNVVTGELDVSDASAVRDLVPRLGAQLGGLDTLVLGAGVLHVKAFQDVTEWDWDRTLNVNLKGAFLVAQAAAPLLSESGRGRVVAISSDAGKKGFPWITAYCASKFGLIGLCEAIAAELASSGVTVNCVCPVSCPTTGMGEMLTSWKADHAGTTVSVVLEAMARSFPLGRYLEIDDVVSAVMFFVSQEASAITGTALDVDAGARLGGAFPGIDG